MPITDFLRKKPLDVADVSDQPTISRTMCLKITGGDDSTTGTGEIVLDWSNIASKADIGVYDENDNLLDYYFETFDETEEKAVIWVFRDWVQDGSTQLQVAYGDGPSDQSVSASTVFSKESGLEAAYLFNEDSGDLIDVSGNNNDGSVTGATQDETGLVGRAYKFDGSDDYVHLGALDLLSTPFTINLIVKQTASADWSRLFIQGYDSPGTNRMILYYDGYLQIHQNENDNDSDPEIGVSISLDEWVHFAWRNDGTDQAVYKNGVDTDDGTSGEGGVFPGETSIAARNVPDDPENFWPGIVDAIIVYGEVLSGDEIAALYDAAKSSPDFFNQQAAEVTEIRPIVSTDEASSVERKSATLNGTLEDMGEEDDVDVYFEWGLDDSYGNTTSQQTMSDTGSFSESLSDLEGGREYHFRAAITDGTDTWYGGDQVFQLTAAPFDYIKTKKLEVKDVSGQPTISRTIPLKITSGDDSTTGGGEIVLDWANISDESDIGIFDNDDNLLDYHIESFNASDETAVVWVYQDWVLDGSTQLQVAYGDGPSDQSVSASTVFDKESDLAGAWLLNETSGDALDVTSNNNDGSVDGATQGEDGIIGGAYDFDGDDDVVNCGDKSDFDFGQDGTIDFWIKPRSMSLDYHGIMTRGESSDCWIIRYNDFDDEMQLRLYGSYTFGAERSLDWDNWEYWAFVIDGYDYKCYRNGDFVREENYDSNDINHTGDLYLGLYKGEDHFNGLMSFARVLKSALTEDEIKAFYDATKDSPDFFSQQAGEDISTVIDIPLASISTRPLHASYGPIFVPLARISTEGLRPLVGGFEEAISIPIAHLRSTVHDPGILWEQQIPKANISASGRKPTPHIELIVPRSRVTVQGQKLTISPRIVAVPLSHISANAHDFVLGWEQLIPQAYISTDIHDPYAFSGFSIPLVGLRTTPLRPRQYWTPDPTEAQTIYQFVLTGSADGEDDITIPISSCQMRRRDGKPTYMSVNVPNYDDYADEILARTNGEMVLKKGVRFNDGTKQLQEIARVEMEMENLRMDKGPNSRSITLVGHKTVSTTDPNKVTINGVSYRNYSGGLRRYRCEVDLWLKPGDLVVIPEEDEEFEVGYISYTIGPREQRMEIKEAE